MFQGRAHELLLILDEHLQNNAHLHSIAIYHASKVTSRLRVYQTYSNMTNARIRVQIDIYNLLRFSHIQNLESIDIDSFNYRWPSVAFASLGMLQSGASRQSFDDWLATDPKNGCLIARYTVENMLAKEIMNSPKDIVTLEGHRRPLNAEVVYVSFSAHVDFMQNKDFMQRVDPKHSILVHGQKDQMGQLKNALVMQHQRLPESERPTVTMPPNLQEVKLKFRGGDL